MIAYSGILLFMLFLFMILFFRPAILRKKKLGVKLFAEALKSENNGHFEEAIITYKTALHEVKKTGMNDYDLEIRIHERLKILQTLIEYKNNLHFTR